MQITLDSVVPNPFVLIPPDSLTFIWPPSWMGVILQYGETAQFLIFNIFKFLKSAI